ncbi:SubName: Full=Uncharacterized protein {ECO:0000313/EMBL:CCA71556.1} [Serendipita indica DSM 11827]|uniref:Integral membrane protein n=1 Tax=Serendipita indica (strain DSM 11827) TaxID=1109443 RepID=G4TJR3_SERID|nr:SubName: Full=Uncharacterized protein {ECO:0000313/EMBL:CCA71556.1} [Serendipita indica DSM 11827]CCA71556.1 hypothetical protein PIIN_05493 [Serendipita indica DSM 11827]
MINLRAMFLFMLSFVADAMAKGRGGGGGGGSSSSGSGGGSSYDPNRDDSLQAIINMAINIVLALIVLSLLVSICRRLDHVTHSTAPYVLLAIVTSTVIAGYATSAAIVRFYKPALALYAVNGFLWDFDIAFEPAVCLWLIHCRGELVTTSQFVNATPWVSQRWKRIVDWSLAALTFIIAITMTSVLLRAKVMRNEPRFNVNLYLYYLDVGRNLKFAVVGLGVLLLINVVISLIALKASQSRGRFVDRITTRLLFIVLPFVILGITQSLAFTIYREINPSIGAIFDLVVVVTGGICRIGTIGGLMATMRVFGAVVPKTIDSTLPLPVDGAHKLEYSQQSLATQPPTGLWHDPPSMPIVPVQYSQPSYYPLRQGSPPPIHKTYNS